MDSISQAALGAAIGEAVIGKQSGHKGAIVGALIATIPDLDVVLYLFYDTYDMLSIHRGYSHSLLFSLLGALLIAYILQRIKWTKQLSYARLATFAFLVLLTHILLDAFTSYGTQMFLPFSNARVGFDSINVVDPVYTLPLLLGLFLSLFLSKKYSRSSRYNFIGLGVSTVYLICTLGVKSHVNNYFHRELSKREVDYDSLLTIPVGIANINWFGVAKTEDSLYLQKYSILSGSYFPFEKFAINDYLLEDVGSELVEKMRWFAKGFYTVEKQNDQIRLYNLQVDMRGIVRGEQVVAPTKGYFILEQDESGSFRLSSGSH